MSCPRGPSSRPLVLLALSVFIAVAALNVRPARADAAGNELLNLSVEELLRVEITSASKKTQRISETAAAAFVITVDDIRRSGARSIPELLRMVPGLEVAQIDGNKWAVTARGFNGRFANKLLVLMDGRALYTPSFSGVFWDVQDTLLEDIERIEIIRGPGGTLWGANAVNGVINIITRSSTGTQGGELVAALASGPSRTASLRFGDKVGDDFTYRVYSRYLDEAGNQDLAGDSTADERHLGRLGARADWKFSERDQLSLSAEAYRGDSGETLMRPLLAPPYTTVIQSEEHLSGFFVIQNWRRELGDGREFQQQAYFDSTDHQALLFGEKRDTALLEVQYRFPVGSRQDVITGAGYRHDAYRFSETSDVSVSPQSPSNAGYNAFVQDEVQLIRDRLSLTLGVDIEHNPLSERDWDALPSGRLLLTLNERNRVWVAITQAISTPSYENTGAAVRNAAPIIPPGTGGNPFPLPVVTAVVANPEAGSERLLAYELGYRTQLGADVTLDSTVYLNEYEDLRGQATTAIYCDPSRTSVFENPLCVLDSTSVVNQLQFQNAMRGHSYGFELAADWVPVSAIRLRAAYAHQQLVLQPTLDGPEIAAEIAVTEGHSPRNQFSLRADVTLHQSLDFDLFVRHVDRLPSIPVPDYWSADANLIWRASRQMELSLGGRNLLQKAHLEFVSELSDVVTTRIERTVAAQVRWTF